jgi:hypothetical protein
MTGTSCVEQLFSKKMHKTIQSNLNSKGHPGKSRHQLTPEVENFKVFLFLQDNVLGPQATIIC